MKGFDFDILPLHKVLKRLIVCKGKIKTDYERVNRKREQNHENRLE